MMRPRPVPPGYTYADYLTWPEGPHEELIDGAVHVREPAPAVLHQAIVGEIYLQVASALKGQQCRAYVAPVDVRLPKRWDEADEHVDTVVQPDVFILCDLRKLDVRGVRGAPDWLAEILSPYTANYDQGVKLAAYERAGVREVWLVHPIDRTVAVYRLDAGRYGRALLLELKGQTRLGAVPGVTVDWDQVLARI